MKRMSSARVQGTVSQRNMPALFTPDCISSGGSPKKKPKKKFHGLLTEGLPGQSVVGGEGSFFRPSSAPVPKDRQAKKRSSSSVQLSNQSQVQRSGPLAKKKKVKAPSAASLPEALTVKPRRWLERFPPLWQPCFLTDEQGNGLCRPEWVNHMDYTALNSPDYEYMSPKLWPALTQLITVIYNMEATNGGRPLTADNLSEIVKTWEGSLKNFGLHDSLEVQLMLRLCKTAMADKSPLTNEQKHFLMMFVACRTQDAGLKTDIFALISRVFLPMPEIPSKHLYFHEPFPSADSRGVQLFGSSSWRRIKKSFIEDKNTIPRQLLYQKGIPLLVWQFARTFGRIWVPNNTCDLAIEFNVGLEDRMNSEYFATYMHLLFGNDSPLTHFEQEILKLLMDLALSEKKVVLKVGSEVVNWRDWLREFQSGVHSLPERPGSIDPLTLMEVWVFSHHRLRRSSSITSVIDYGDSSSDQGSTDTERRTSIAASGVFGSSVNSAPVVNPLTPGGNYPYPPSPMDYGRGIAVKHVPSVSGGKKQARKRLVSMFSEYGSDEAGSGSSSSSSSSESSSDSESDSE